jgi:spoIIIJ-associated protein
VDKSAEFAKKHLEDILSFYGLNSDVRVSSDDDVITLEIPSSDMNAFLIGHNGETLAALQFVVTSALKAKGDEFVRVNIDVADYKKQRAGKLEDQVKAWAAKIKASGGTPMELEPMNSTERRIVHQAATELGLATESIGDGRDRHILLCLPE